MPKRPRSHELEDRSRSKLHEIFTARGWTVEDLSKDYGEDLLVRVFSAGVTTPFVFFVQAKATGHISRYLNRTKTDFLYPIGTDHLRHWERFWEPVIITGRRVSIFGRAAAELGEIAASLGITPEQALHVSLAWCRHVFERLSAGEKIVGRDADGRVLLSWGSFEDLFRYVRGVSELDEEDG